MCVDGIVTMIRPRGASSRLGLSMNPRSFGAWQSWGAPWRDAPRMVGQSRCSGSRPMVVLTHARFSMLTPSGRRRRWDIGESSPRSWSQNRAFRSRRPGGSRQDAVRVVHGRDHRDVARIITRRSPRFDSSQAEAPAGKTGPARSPGSGRGAAVFMHWAAVVLPRAVFGVGGAGFNTRREGK